VIPADNPFENDGDPTTRGEIWSWGVRNPWRFTFDRMTGDLYIGDVGQNCFEEVTVSLAAEAGVNHGWDLMEADTCFIDTQPNRCRDDCASCSSVSNAGLTCADLRGPVVELDQGATGACSVISGYAYRGCRLPDLAGTYFYSDWCAEFVRTFELDPGPPLAAVNADDFTSQVPQINSPSAFGQDVQGEMYLVNLSGEVHRIVPN